MKFLLSIVLFVFISACDTRYMASIENRSEKDIFISKSDDITNSYKIAPKSTRIINWNYSCQLVGVDFKKQYLNTSDSSKRYISHKRGENVSFYVYFENDTFFIKDKNEMHGPRIQEVESCKST